MFLNKSHFAGNGLSSDQGDDNTTYQELIFSCRVTGSLVPSIKACPGVVIDGI